MGLALLGKEWKSINLSWRMYGRENNEILSVGYNGFPRGCSDKKYLGRDGGFLETKYAMVCHMELNAILLR